MPQTLMKAVIIHKFGGPEVLTVIPDYPVPEPAPNQVLVRTYATALNPLDLELRKGSLSLFTGRKFPIILGNDISGEVVATGSKVTRFKKGDKVFCMSDTNPASSKTGFAKSSAYAEYCITREDTLALLPENISETDAASLPLTSLTAYQAITRVAKAQKGQSILINGASGGVGVMAVQIARALGLRVTAVCRPESFLLITTLGADLLIDYKTTDFTCKPDRYDIIFDVAVTKTFDQCKHVLKKNGVYISNLATFPAIRDSILTRFTRVFGDKKRCTFNWVTSSGTDLDNVASLIRVGKIKPVVDKVFPLEQAKQAHIFFENHNVTGKVLLRI